LLKTIAIVEVNFYFFSTMTKAKKNKKRGDDYAPHVADEEPVVDMPVAPDEPGVDKVSVSEEHHSKRASQTVRIPLSQYNSLLRSSGAAAAAPTTNPPSEQQTHQTQEVLRPIEPLSSSSVNKYSAVRDLYTNVQQHLQAEKIVPLSICIHEDAYVMMAKKESPHWAFPKDILRLTHANLDEAWQKDPLAMLQLWMDATRRCNSPRRQGRAPMTTSGCTSSDTPR
jgi:hypothetical protein